MTRLVRLTLLAALAGNTAVITTSCVPILAATNTLPDAPTCSNSGRSCQMHWLICAGFCETPIDHVDTQTCGRYEVQWRRMCADVRAVPFSDATCEDHRRGVCEHMECDPRPEGCE